MGYFVRSTEHVTAVAETWDEVIDCGAWAKREGRPGIELTRWVGKDSVLDVAVRIGFPSVQLLEADVDVADGRAEVRSRAFANARRCGWVRSTADSWRWCTRDVCDECDVIVSLGSSFTLLFQEQASRML